MCASPYGCALFERSPCCLRRAMQCPHPLQRLTGETRLHLGQDMLVTSFEFGDALGLDRHVGFKMRAAVASRQLLNARGGFVRAGLGAMSMCTICL